MLLVACGGGSSSSTPPSEPETPAAVTVPEIPAVVTVTGKVIDGYISGATVWMDLNANSILDETEPQVISSSAGNFAFELTSEQMQCLPYVSLYVDVPIGAIDEEQGVVDQPYQMVLPPRMQTMQGDLYITPLTTLLYDVIREEFANQATYIDNGINYDTRFTVNSAYPGFSALADWIDLNGRAEELDATELVNYIKNLPYRFEDTVDNNQFLSWSKRSTDDREPERVMIEQESNGSWMRFSYRPDGTYFQECGTDGEHWAECE